MRLILLHLFKHYDFNLSYDQLLTTHNSDYQGINLFTMGPQSIHKKELLGMYVNIVKRKSNL